MRSNRNDAHLCFAVASVGGEDALGTVGDELSYFWIEDHGVSFIMVRAWRISSERLRRTWLRAAVYLRLLRRTFVLGIYVCDAARSPSRRKEGGKETLPPQRLNGVGADGDGFFGGSGCHWGCCNFVATLFEVVGHGHVAEGAVGVSAEQGLGGW